MVPPLFKVKEVFSIKGRATVVATDTPFETLSLPLQVGEKLAIQTVSGEWHTFTVGGIEDTNPAPGFAVLLQNGLAASEITVGDEVWLI